MIAACFGVQAIIGKGVAIAIVSEESFIAKPADEFRIESIAHRASRTVYRPVDEIGRRPKKK